MTTPPAKTSASDPDDGHTERSRPSRTDALPGPDGDPGDQDIDTAGTEADDEAISPLGPPARKGGSPRHPDAKMADAPDNERPPIGPHDPASMRRREDDDRARTASPDFSDRPGSGKHR